MANSAAGALVLTARLASLPPLELLDGGVLPMTTDEIEEENQREYVRRRDESAQQILDACVKDGYFGFPD